MLGLGMIELLILMVVGGLIVVAVLVIALNGKKPE